MVAAATTAAMTMVRPETRACSASRRPASTPSVFNRTAINLCDLCFFPELRLERATTVTRRVSLLLQIVHALGGGQGPPAPSAIAACVEPLGARHDPIERCSRALLGPLHRTGRRLAIELRANWLRRHWPCVRIVGRLAHSLFELRDSARAGMRAQDPSRTSDNYCKSSVQLQPGSPIANALPLSRNQHLGSINAPRISRRSRGSGWTTRWAAQQLW